MYYYIFWINFISNLLNQENQEITQNLPDSTK